MAQWRPTSTNWAEGRHLKSDAPSASRTRSVPSIVAHCAISFFHIITELRDLRVELQFHFPRRTVALFGDDQFSKPEHAFHLNPQFGVMVKVRGFIPLNWRARSAAGTIIILHIGKATALTP